MLDLINNLLKPYTDDSGYPEPRPELPLAAYGLAFGMLIGLIALWLAAFDAFGKTQTPLHAFFSSAIVELGAVVGAIALARARGWADIAFAFLEVAISLVVSATYNYVQVSVFGANNGITDPWQLYTFALGPLAALTGVSVNLGRIFREVEALTAEWSKKRGEWINMTTAEKAAHARAEKEKQELERLERERLERERADRLAQEQARREFDEREAQRRHERNLRRIENKSSDNSREKNGEKLSPNSHGDSGRDKKSKKKWVDSYMKKTGKSQAQAYRDHKSEFGW